MHNHIKANAFDPNHNRNYDPIHNGARKTIPDLTSSSQYTTIIEIMSQFLHKKSQQGLRSNTFSPNHKNTYQTMPLGYNYIYFHTQFNSAKCSRMKTDVYRSSSCSLYNRVSSFNPFCSPHVRFSYLFNNEKGVCNPSYLQS